MKATDLSGLIKGLMIVIGIAMAFGKLDVLRQWAAREAFGKSNHAMSHRIPCPPVHRGILKVRKQQGLSIDQNSKVGAIREELADIFIYLCSIANRYDIDLEKAFREKEEINKQRTWTK